MTRSYRPPVNDVQLPQHSQAAQILRRWLTEGRGSVLAGVSDKRFRYLDIDAMNDIASTNNMTVLANNEIMAHVVPHTKAQMASTVVNAISPHKKLFILAIRACLTIKELQELIALGLTDGSLPLPGKKYKDYEGYFHHDIRLWKNYHLLRAEQNFFLPVVLGPSIFTTVPTGTIVSIKGETDHFAKGTGGKVYKARIDTYHHAIPGLLPDPQDPRWSVPVAVKQLPNMMPPASPDSPSAYDAVAADREVTFASVTASNVQNAHITQFYGTFEARLPPGTHPATQNRYLISELAHCNLHAYLSDSHQHISTHAHWLRHQIKGLSSALAHLHNPTAGYTGLHHAIKPANILLFPTHNLKLTDWGAACYFDVTTTVGSPSSLDRGQMPYAPPEAGFRVPTSRAHDVWSLGCVFLEMLVWVARGPDARAELLRAAVERDGYFSGTGTNQVLIPEASAHLAGFGCHVEESCGGYWEDAGGSDEGDAGRGVVRCTAGELVDAVNDAGRQI